MLILNLVLTYGIPPEFRGGVHLFIYNHHTSSGQPRVYRVTRLRTDGVHCRKSAGTGPVNLKVVPNESGSYLIAASGIDYSFLLLQFCFLLFSGKLMRLIKPSGKNRFHHMGHGEPPSKQWLGVQRAALMTDRRRSKRARLTILIYAGRGINWKGMMVFKKLRGRVLH